MTDQTTPQNRTRRLRWCIAAASAAGIAYCLAVLAYVITAPDLRMRCLLADEDDAAAAPPGVTLEATPGLRFRGPDGPRVGDRVVAIHQRPTPTFCDFVSRLRELRGLRVPEWARFRRDVELSGIAQLLPDVAAIEIQGQPYVRVEWYRGDRSHRGWVAIQSPPVEDLTLSLVWAALQTGIFVVAALAVWYRPFDPGTRQFFVMSLTTMAAFLGGFNWLTIAAHPLLNGIFVAAAVLTPVVSLHFFLVYPTPLPAFQRHPRSTLGTLYAVAGLAFAYFVVLLHAAWTADRATPLGIARCELALSLLRSGIYAYLLFSAACYLAMLVALAYAFRRQGNPLQRHQVRLMFWAGCAAAVPVGYSLWMALFDRVAFAVGHARWPMFIAGALFMLAYAIGIVRYELMLGDQSVSRPVRWYLAHCAATAVAGVVIAVLGQAAFWWCQSQVPSLVVQHAVFMTGIVALSSMLLLLVRDRVRHSIDQHFYREKYRLGEALQEMNLALNRVLDRKSVAERFLQSCVDVLQVECAGLYWRSAEGGAFTLLAGRGDRPLPLECLVPRDVGQWMGSHTALVRGAAGVQPAVTEFLDHIGAELLYPLGEDDNPVGLVVLGEKRGGVPFSAEDLTFVDAVAQLTRAALHSLLMQEHAAHLEQRLRQEQEAHRRLRQQLEDQKRQIATLQDALAQRTDGETSGYAEAAEQPEFRRGAIRGRSPAIRHVLETVRKVARSEASVLLLGESGTGKELVAQAIHENSPRRDGPLVRVHCAALSPSLLESELFGHVKGAFTGAHRDRVGRFEMADGGTLFLDEIGDISLETQVKLLRVLQTKSFEPVGSTRTVTVDVRLVAATHRDLRKMIAEGKFREDLYYRLNVITIWLPPLRERREDIFDLALHFLRRAAERTGKPVRRIDEAVIPLLEAYPWPGNVRELENVIERAVVLAEGDRITLDDLPPELVHSTPLAARRSTVVLPPRAASAPRSTAPQGPPEAATEPAHTPPTKPLEATSTADTRQAVSSAVPAAPHRDRPAAIPPRPACDSDLSTESSPREHTEPSQTEPLSTDRPGIESPATDPDAPPCILTDTACPQATDPTANAVTVDASTDANVPAAAPRAVSQAGGTDTRSADAPPASLCGSRPDAPATAEARNTTPDQATAAATPSATTEHPRRQAKLRLSEEEEITLIRTALQRCNGNKAEAARWLGVPRSTLYNKIKKYGIM
ncbi:MAG: AAA family ATPase [Planctomycetota bacterium]|nr:MAG: AAA family ATPase [Planctomycetota bacterium]